MSAPLSTMRVAIAAAIALLGSVFVWVAVPYNNFKLKNTYVCDSYLPEVVVGFLLLLILAVNPLLRLIGRRWMLDRRQVALICSLMLFAAILPSNGLMRMFPRFVAETNQGLNTSVTTARIAAAAGFRQVLFPDPLPTLAPDGRVQSHETPLSDQFLGGLEAGATVPWRAWLAPMAVWGGLILALWIMMVGLGGVVYPQWRDNERLPFPLLTVYQAWIGEAEEDAGRTLPAIFYSHMFWIGCGVVFLIHAFRGLDVFTGGAFPSFPLSWNLKELAKDSVLWPSILNRQTIFFAVVGVAYFIPNRYAISIWAWMLLYGWYLAIGSAYVPAFAEGQVDDQITGSLLAITVWVLWLGRAHWAKVGRAMFGKAGNDAEAQRNAMAGWMFALGCAGIVLWLYWAGCAFWWCVLAMLACTTVSLLMARIIAETGVPVLWLGRISVSSFTSFFPLAWLSPTILFFMGSLNALLSRTTAVSAAVMSTLSLGIDAEASPSYQKRLLLGGAGLLLLGFIICGAVHLNMGYHNVDLGTQGKFGANCINEWARVDRKPYEFFTAQHGHQAAGFGLSSAMLWACSRFPAWPLHPVGMMFCRFSIGNLLWFSIFLGWLIKTTITRLFGGGAYRKAKPLFLGLIVGELLAIMVWTIVPLVIIWATGADPATVPRYMLIQYP